MARPPMFQRATVTRIVKETADARTYVLSPHEAPISYRAGQFITFKVHVDGAELFRSYSMSSAPETDSELMTTVKRVPGGKVSNWMHDNISEGDEVEITRAAGLFCLSDTSAPLLGFAGGSGITPILSLTKSALKTTDRRIRLLCADRDPAAAIFHTAIDELAAQYPDRLSVVRSFDVVDGFLDAAKVLEFVGDDTDADSYLCGPDPFMAVIKSALPGPGRVIAEEFGAAAQTVPDAGLETEIGTEIGTGTGTTVAPAELGTVYIQLGRKKVEIGRKPGETILESARRAGLSPPFSCESGNCATCIGEVLEGSATMRANNALDDDEVADGMVLTCQAVPNTPSIKVKYE
ncbi:ferredoxin--NADP reductase [Williamsia sp.]|uniref:ferredoxin--NADP reductase n=1 Tax=Williamsia sp. TaxID=1872085 RepID=UPI002F951EA4